MPNFFWNRRDHAARTARSKILSTIAIVASPEKTPQEQKQVNENIRALVEECAQNGVDVRMTLDMRNPTLAAALASTHFAIQEHPNAKATIVEPWPNTKDRNMAQARGISGEFDFVSVNLNPKAREIMQEVHEGGWAGFNKQYPAKKSDTNLQLTQAAVIHGASMKDTADAVVLATDTTAEKLDNRVAAAMKLAAKAELPVFDIRKALTREEITAFVSQVKENGKNRSNESNQSAEEIQKDLGDRDRADERLLVHLFRETSAARILNNAAETYRGTASPEDVAKHEKTLIRMSAVSDSNFPSRVTAIQASVTSLESYKAIVENVNSEDREVLQNAVSLAFNEKAERKAAKALKNESELTEENSR